MRNLILILITTFSWQAHAQVNANQFDEKDACDLSGVLSVMPDTNQMKVIGTFANIGDCEYNACYYAGLASGKTASDSYTSSARSWCEEGSRKSRTLFSGIVATDTTLYVCDLNPKWPNEADDNSKYRSIVSRTVPKSDAQITQELCTAIKACFRNALTPSQAAWATWKSTSLYCQ